MSVTVAQVSADRLPVQQQWRPEVVPTSQSADDSLASLLGAMNAKAQAGGVWEQAARTILVVPGPDLPADGLTAITEDMAVMCRILDQATAPILMSTDALKVFDPFSGRAMRDRPGTQGLYLDGYGALFFIQATFPLVPSSSEQEPAKAEPSTDPVWSRAVDELRGSPQKQPQPVPQYEAQKVETLKTALIKSLRHATNLRVRGPQDTLTVVITVWGGAGYAFVYTPDQQGPARFEPTGIDTSAVLVLRTTKADVDALAKGDLAPEQFAAKVQVLRSWTNSGREPAASTTFVVPSTGSRGGRAGTRW
jgi:hypothetical protein